ncbi:nuclear transport factor 2 family protein [Actinomadura bangladeshensis]|uniref:Nuclear transport factor 2 family protein n=1 Tax=Actinomadura bangladeshensis TaxID=453573 RepID=A0A4R4PCJ6_9ACTN|nr:nuclear transport factor 2 family protein [Actinomadura bangladeshensis]TDC20351.1 nuclear transport factor 2 family protein [Actinomadura bangladeshensis]
MTDPTGASARLADRERIRDLAVTYCFALDDEDPELMKSVFWPDAHDDHEPMFSGPAWEFADRFVAFRDSVRPTTHFVLNHVIRFGDDPHEATGRLYGGGFQFVAAEPARGPRVVIGTYTDRYQRREGEWRILERRFRYTGTVRGTAPPRG